MPSNGDSYIIELKQAHLEWGVYRHTDTRSRIPGEGYLPIPRQKAVDYSIYNGNHSSVSNIYECTSQDGYLLQESVKASGSSRAGDIYAKQFQGNEDLSLFGRWFSHVNAQIGDHVRVTFTGPSSFEIEKI
ncbi:hypothetical protein [Lacicoccus alkaliphilus]|uniref:Uncharacterized protein n=1 Tax=Lacicoccus alkaliphilus DSM 16010 TaxID=1123231 RepID=A0A1M7KJY5_9BACL|nr:hypothetical protein [Salinicoccus alkaliphilus]SHM65714.1 hypothetical protein SAMN02745189_02566 [Salinicoccus alkaliphilus DSM 16010]